MTTENTIQRRTGERRTHHRGLLLFGMQATSKRSIRAVARALGVSEGSVRNWRDRGDWLERLNNCEGPQDAECLALYRSEYLSDFGRAELPLVARNIIQPLGITEHDNREAHEQQAETIRESRAESVAIATSEQAALSAVNDYRRDLREDTEKHIKLVDASLGLIARKLRADEVRVTVRDIPVLLECRDRLVSVVSGTHGSAGIQAVETVRVKAARKEGTDILEAMLIDAEEVLVIIRALHSAGKSQEDRQEDRPIDGETYSDSAG